MYIQVQQDYCFSCCLMLTFFTWKSTCVFKKFFVKQPNLGGAKQFTWYTVNSRVKISHNLTGPRAELQTCLKFWMLELSRFSVVL